MNEDRYFLDRDDSGHWYLVLAARRVEWNTWLDLDEDDPESWECPAFADRLSGAPSSVTFEKPTASLANR